MDVEITRNQLDALKEIVTIGAGNAATALSQMLGKKVTIEVPSVKLCRIDEVSDIFGGPEKFVVAVFLRLLGDASGVILFSFEKEEANKIADVLLGLKIGKTRILNEMAQSSLKETATILSGAYLNALSKMLKMKFLISSPSLTQDMAGAVIDNVLIETSKSADYTIIMDTELCVVDEKIVAYFFFIPDVDSLHKILQSLKVNGGN